MIPHLRPALLALLAAFTLLAPSALAADPVMVAAGDIACGGDTPSGTDCKYSATADTVGTLSPTVVVPLGDIQYEQGQLAYFNQYYNATWGRFKSITRPAVGNHEYLTSGAAGYFDYFNGVGQASGPAGDRTKGYYSYDVGSWHVVTLNSNCNIVSCSAGGAQEKWLRADLAANTKQCTVAVAHHPRWSSDYYELNSPYMDPLVKALYDSGVDLLLVGHAHDYERFAPQTPSGTVDTTRGLTQIVVGTGGRSEVSFSSIPNPNSLVRKTGTYGVLKLGMHNGFYDYKFVPVAGQTWTDSGADTCNNAQSSTNRVLTFPAAADTYADSGNPTKSFGSDARLKADGSPQKVSYLKFNVSGLGGAKVSSARLRLYDKDASNAGGTVNAVADSSWTESSLNWNNKPAPGTLLGSFGAVSANNWYELDVTPLVKGDGTVSIRVASTSSDEVQYASNEGGTATAPQLVVTAAPGDTTAPSVPGKPTANAVSSNRVELSWAASTDNVGVSGYRIFRNGTPVGTSATTSYADTTASPSTTYTYTVSAYDAAGNESAQSQGTAATTPAATQTTATLTFQPTDDTYASAAYPSSNFGGESTFIYDGDPFRNSFLKFNVAGIGTKTVTKVVLRLTAENPSVFGGQFQRVADTTWTQGSLTWNNQPAADTTILAKMGATVTNTVYDVDVTGLLTKDGAASIRISSNNADGGGYYSLESGFKPQLLVSVG